MSCLGEKMINENDVIADSLTMNKLYFESITFNSFGNTAPLNGTANVGYKETHTICGDCIDVKLSSLIEVLDIFKLELCLVGNFKTNSPRNAEKMLPNAIAIMFPYLRAQVSLLTAQPNIPCITLKPININAFLQQQGKNKD